MRKFLLLFALLVTSICKVNSQASGYTFSSSSGTYTAITGGTLIKDGTTSMDSYASGAITIPSFTFNGTAYTTAYATSNGFITLGGSAPSAFTSTGISSTTGSGIAICPMSADLDRANTNANTEMRWETVGDEVVFQWKQMKRYGITENFDFQARLNTVSGVITFVYQLNSGPGTSTSYQPQVGIRTSTSDYKNRLVASGSETWAASLAGTANNNTCRFTATAPAKSFTSGQTYTFIPPACLTPTAFAIGSITNNSASASFTSGGTAFIVEYGAPGFTPGTDNNAGVGGTIATGSASPISISGLTTSTTYDVYIRQDCGSGVYSSNSAKVTFTTLCDAVSTFPYTQGFNAASLPACWSATEGSPGATQHWQPVTADAGNGAGASAEGSHFLRMNYYNASTTYNPYFLKSPAFSLDATPKRAKFALWMGSASGTNNLKFEVSTDNGVSWTTLTTYTANPANSSSSAPWDNGQIVDLTAYTNQTVLFRLNATSNYGSGYCNIGFDNFVIEDMPSCAEPTALSAGSITNNAASISFTSGGTAFILEYGAAGFTPGTDNNPGVGGTIVTGSASPIAMSGLTGNTVYDVYVRQDCGGGTYSVNSAKVTFTTLCDATTVPYTQNFESATAPALPPCTAQENVGLGNNWVTASAPGSGFTSKTLKYGYSGVNDANVWFYTQGINLTNGIAYTISYRYGNNGYQEKLKVAYGSAANNGSMTNVLADHPNITQTNQSNTVTFTPSATGVYYFGFNAYSDADQYNLYVDDIVIDVAPWTWTGTTNTDWNTASNWDLGSVPTATNSVVIADVTNKPVVDAGTFQVKNLTINSNSSLTINGTLQVNGNITNNATIDGTGSLTLVGTSSQTFNVGSTGATIANFSLNNIAGATLSGTGKLNVTNVLAVQDGNSLETGGVVVLKSTATQTARIAPIGTGSITGNVTVERYIPAKVTRKWSLLSSPITQSVANSWQQQIHITGAGTGGTLCPTLSSHTNGFDATLTNASNMFTYNAAGTPGNRWTAVASTNADNLMAGKGFRVNVRGDRSLGCDLLNGVNMVPSAVTLSSSGTISNADKNMGSFSITYPNVGISNYVLVGNPYPSALSFSALQGANGASIGTNYAIYVPASLPGVYSYWDDNNAEFTGGTGYDDTKGNTIASGQAVFVQSLVAGDVTLNFTETQKDTEGTAGYFRSNNTKDRVRISLNKDEKIDEVVIRYANDATVSNTTIGKKDIPSMNYGTYITSLKGTTHTAVQTRSLSTLSTDEVWLNIGATQSGNYSLSFSQYEDFAGADIYLVDHLAKTTQNIKENATYVFSVDVNNAATKGSARFSLVFTKRSVEPTIVYNSIKMYPNPANTQVTLLLPQSADIRYQIKVTDMTGKVVMQSKAAGGTTQMNINRLTKGAYLVEVTDSKGNRTTEKLIKN